MVWLTLRQHRTELTVMIGITVLVCTILVITGIPIHHLYTASGIANCVQYWNFPGNCGMAFDNFTQPTAYARTYLPWLNLLPLLYGLLIGVPLLAREHEQHTAEFIWMQGISRTRWLLSKIVILLVPLLVCALAITLTTTWWDWPFDQVSGPFDLPSWDFEGVMPVTYGILAFSIGIAAGAWTKRIIPAVALTFLYVPLWLVADNWLRTKIPTPIEGYYGFGQGPMLHRQDWIIIDQFVNKAGNPQYNVPSCSTTASCVANQGAHWHVVFQPLSRFGEIQSIEAAILGGVALLLLGLAFWRVRRRTE